MNIKFYLLFLLSTPLSIVFSQIFILSGEIGTFESAVSFSINPSGQIFVADNNTNEIIKVDQFGAELKRVGGFGWGEAVFDNPAYISSNTLNVYTADKNNNRIQIFDKDLNFISSFSKESSDNENEKFLYPNCVEVSGQGDFFILDSENKRILKFSARGGYLLTLGGYDAGSYTLSYPKAFSINAELEIWVVNGNSLLVFDQFGFGIKKIPLKFSPNTISVSFNQLVMTTKDSIIILDSKNNEFTFIPSSSIQPGFDEEICDAKLFGEELYILSRTSIYKGKVNYQK